MVENSELLEDLVEIFAYSIEFTTNDQPLFDQVYECFKTWNDREDKTYKKFSIVELPDSMIWEKYKYLSAIYRRFHLKIAGLPQSSYPGEIFTLQFSFLLKENDLNLAFGDDVQVKFVDNVPVHPKVSPNGDVYMGVTGARDSHRLMTIPMRIVQIVEYVISELSSVSTKCAPITREAMELMRRGRGLIGDPPSTNLYELFHSSWKPVEEAQESTISTTQHMRLIDCIVPEGRYKFNYITADELEVDIDGRNSAGSSLLGLGGFAQVYPGKYGSKHVAVKVPLYESDDSIPTMKNEAHILTMLNHKNIVKCYGVVDDLAHYNIGLVLERWESNLEYIMRDDYPYNVDHIFSWMHQIVDALHYVHSRGFLHRDVKPANILIRSLEPGFDGRSTVAVADMNISNVIEYGGITDAGTRNYAAPEVAVCGAQTPACDIFSAGLMYYDLLMGKLRELPDNDCCPFATENDRPPVFLFDDKIMRTIERCWHHVPEKRPQALELLALLRKRWQAYAQFSADSTTPSEDQTMTFKRLAMRRGAISREKMIQSTFQEQSYQTASKKNMWNLPNSFLDVSVEGSAPVIGGKFGKLFKPKRKDKYNVVIKVPDADVYTKESLILECANFVELQLKHKVFAYCYGIFSRGNDFGFVLEYSNEGTLLDLMSHLKRQPVEALTSDHVTVWLRHALSALTYLQDYNFWIGSLGPQSFLLTDAGSLLKMCDLSTLTCAAENDDHSFLHDLPNGMFAAPEVLLRDLLNCGPGSDVFSTAAIFHELYRLIGVDCSEEEPFEQALRWEPLFRISASDARSAVKECTPTTFEPVDLPERSDTVDEEYRSIECRETRNRQVARILASVHCVIDRENMNTQFGNFHYGAVLNNVDVLVNRRGAYEKTIIFDEVIQDNMEIPAAHCVDEPSCSKSGISQQQGDQASNGANSEENGLETAESDETMTAKMICAFHEKNMVRSVVEGAMKKLSIILAERNYTRIDIAKKCLMLGRLRIIGTYVDTPEHKSHYALGLMPKIYGIAHFGDSLYGYVTDPPAEHTVQDVISGNLDGVRVKDCVEMAMDMHEIILWLNGHFCWLAEMLPKHFCVSKRGGVLRAKLFNIALVRTIFENEDRWNCTSPYSPNENHEKTLDRNNTEKYKHQPGSMFSLGITFWQMLTQKNPFPDADSETIHKMIYNDMRPAKLPAKYSALEKLVYLCTHPEPTQRTFDYPLENSLDDVVPIESGDHPVNVISILEDIGQPVSADYLRLKRLWESVDVGSPAPTSNRRLNSKEKYLYDEVASMETPEDPPHEASLLRDKASFGAEVFRHVKEFQWRNGK